MNLVVEKQKGFWTKHGYLLYLVVFVAAFLVFFYLQAAPGFADPDSFYHAKMAVLIKENGGAIRQFPWLQFTLLKNGYTDHHFLYHLLLVPFVTFLPPLIGIKLAAILFASLAILTIYWFLRAFQVKGAIFYALFLLIVQPFVFRMSLAKAPALSLIFLLLALYFLQARKKWQLFILSFFYVWLYGGWPLIIIFTIIFLVVELILEAVKKSWHYRLARVLTRFNPFKKHRLRALIWLKGKLLLIVVGGVLSSLYVNPYFPDNLKFYWHQTFKIAVINYQKIIGVGAEWYPYYFGDLINDIFLVVLLFGAAMVFFIFSFKKQSKFSWGFLVLSGLFFLLTLKSRRNIEYLAPLTAMFSAFSINGFLVNNQRLLKNIFKFWIQQKKICQTAGVGLFIVFWLLVGRGELISAKKALSDGYKFTYLKEASYYLYDNSNVNEIVFHSDWDEFPLLFYYNSKNNYIVGLDPTFMYEFSRERYWDYVDITLGRRAEEIYDIIKNRFGASFVLVTNNHEELIRNLQANFYFELVYADEEAMVFKVL